MKVLIAEDNQNILELLNLCLAKDKFVVETAMTGTQAFEMAKKERYDAIVLDIMLPEKSGFEIIGQLRALKNNTPILVISARGSLEDKTMALNLGADDYLVKDFAVQELVARLKSLIRRSSGVSKNVFFCEDLSLNLSDMVVRRGGKILSLTRKEFVLLTELLRNKNRVVTTDHLIQAAWDSQVQDHNSNKLNVHMRALRMKVDAPFDKALIQTVRGFGYQISSPSKKSSK